MVQCGAISFTTGCPFELLRSRTVMVRLIWGVAYIERPEPSCDRELQPIRPTWLVVEVEYRLAHRVIGICSL